MADNVSNVTLNVDDKGTLKALIKDAEKLQKTLKSAAQYQSGQRVPTPVASARAAGQAEAGQQSGLARGIGGQTGAASRDFAKQAEGLGGLVRVYATFAANIFAVTAAFGALSRAADTANLVKGLDQLGAASGRNLGSLAKQLVATTDGAISLREALTATAQASSGGLSNENILKLGQVAKQASQALGIDMVNAVSRLSRGITKLEPELLDEIGIFVRVDKASADYARSIGKSASALTDFEKRQAFANAVLEQGAAKFGAVQLDANPYSKIQASLENLSFTALNAVNTAFAPLLNILASSPTALGLVVAGFANILLRQAIPAIGQYRQRLAESAKDARDLVVQTNALRKEQKYAKESKEGIQAVERLNAAKKFAEAAEKEAEALKSSKAIREKAVGQFLPKATTGGEEQLIALRKVQLGLEKEIATAAVSPAVLARRTTELDIVKKVSQAINSRLSAEKEIEKIDETVSSSKLRRYVSLEAAQDRLADKAAARSQRVNILSDISNGVASRGVAGSFAELNKQVKLYREGFDAAGVPLDNNQKKMTALNGAMTKVIGTAQILGSALGTVVSSLGQFAVIATVVVGLGNALYTLFSTGAREADNFAASSDTLSSAVENVDRTLDSVRKKQGAEVISVSSIMASANALEDLSSALTKTAEDLQRLISARSGMESFVDSIFDAFGKGDSDKLAAGLAGSVTRAIKLIPVGPAREEAKAKIQSILEIKDLSSKTIDKAVDSLSIEDASSKARLIADAIAQISKESKNSAGNLQSLQSSLRETSKLVNDQVNSLKPTDIQGKLGSALINDSFEINKALKDPIKGITTLNDIVKDTNLLSLLPTEFGTRLAKANSEIKRLADSVGEADKAVTAAEEKLEKAKKDNKGTVQRGSRGTIQGSRNDGAELVEAKRELEKALAAQASARIDANKFIGSLPAVGTEFFKAGLSKMEVSLKGAVAEGGIIAAKGYLSVLKQAGGATAAEETRLNQQQIDIQIKLVDANFAQVEAAKKLELAMLEANALERVSIAENRLNGGALSDNARDAALKDIAEANKELVQVKLQQNLVSSKSTAAFKAAGTSGNPVLEEAANAVRGFFTVLFGKEGQLAKLYGQKQAEAIQGRLNVAAEGIDATKRGISSEISKISTQQKLLETRKEVVGTYDSEIQRQEESLQLKQLELKYELDLAENAKKIAASSIALQAAKAGSANERNAIEAQNKALQERTNLIAAKEAEVLTLRISNINKVAAAQKAVLAESYALQDRLLAAEGAIFQEQIASDELALQNREKLGVVSETDLAIKKAGLEIEKLTYENSLKTLDLDRKKTQVESDYQTAVAKANALNDPEARAKALASANRVRSDGLLAIQAEQIANESVYKSKLKGVEATKTASMELSKQNQLLKDQETTMSGIVGIADSLSKAFGTIGDAIGNSLKVIQEAANKRQTLDNNWKNDQQKLQKDSKEYNKAQQKYIRESAELEINAAADVAGSVKTMFKEKTAAYKAFSILERGLHAIKMANSAISLATDIKQTISEVANSSARSVTKGTEAVVSALTLPPPAGFIAGAAMAALVASLIGKSVGRGGSMPKGFDAESQQKVQGTGQTYKDGELVNRAGGVLGDPTAKANSLNNSIEKLEEHSFKTMEYSNDMLDNLKLIKKNTDALSALIQGSGLNTRGLDPDGTIQFGKSIDKNIVGQSVVDANNLLFGKGTGITNAMNKLAVSVFGGKKSTELLDVGVQFEGPINNLIEQLKTGGEGLDALYQNIKTTTSGGWFRSSKTSFDTEVQELDRRQAEAFGNIFGGIADSIKAASSVLGKDSKEVEDAIASFNLVFKTSFKDLKPEELTAALEAEFSVAFNSLAERVLPEFETFRKSGEEFGDTIVRLARDVQVAGLSAESAGLSIGDITKYQKAGESIQQTIVRVTETYIDAAGGLDALVEKNRFFADNFLTEAERLAPVQKRVTDEMARLGYSSVDTREEFAALVKSVAAMGPEAANLYAALLNVQEGFAEITPELKKTLSAEDLRKAQLQQTIKILQLEGRSQEALNLTRQEELDSLDDRLKQMQMYIYQHEDLIKIRDAENKILNAMGYSYPALVRTRWEEMKGLTGLERELRVMLYQQEDLAKTTSIYTELLEAQGDVAEAVAIRRKQELKGLSATDQALKIRVWRLQDEKKLTEQANNQSIRIFNLLGQSEKALALTRAEELKQLDDQLKPAQLYIYALEDEAALKDKLRSAYEKEASAVKSVLEGLKASSKALKEYKQQLLLSDKSILDPTQKYQLAKAKALQLAADASVTPVTEDQIKKRDDALSKLPDATDSWLEASRVLFASSQTYTDDFNSVLKIIDSTAGILDAQESVADKQLTALEGIKKYLDSIDGRDITTQEYMLRIKDATANTAIALANLNANLTSAKNPTAKPVGAEYALGSSGKFDENTILKGTAGFTSTVKQARADIAAMASQPDYMARLYGIAVANGFTSTMLDEIAAWSPGTSLVWALSKGLPAFKNGGLSMSGGLVGEEGPELVDFQTPGRVYSASNTATMIGNTTQLINEIKALRAEVSQLRKEQAEQTGHLIGANIMSSDKTAEAIEKAASNSADSALWAGRNALKLA